MLMLILIQVTNDHASGALNVDWLKLARTVSGKRQSISTMLPRKPYAPYLDPTTILLPLYPSGMAIGILLTMGRMLDLLLVPSTRSRPSIRSSRLQQHN